MWTSNGKTRTKIQNTQRRMERSSMDFNLRDRVRNTDNCKKTKVRDVLTFSLQMKWRWADELVLVAGRDWLNTAKEQIGILWRRLLPKGDPCKNN
ncbi:hypothetical protein EVAR_83029_1 [Eumeta japonica]|uniref:Uncharacterized protein n=1 Tax=Eumeta variegata TaxID=151549 RepID=A0A4C1VPU1_EUMVA|nr:hypothetical protein EVAR_83029_1 [Eumeta japonica]